MPEVIKQLSSLVSDPLQFASDLFDWWVWAVDPLMWYLPYTVLLGVELVVGRKVRASWRDVAFNYAYLTVWVVIFTIMSQYLSIVVEWVDSYYTGPVLDMRFATESGILVSVGALFVFYFIYDCLYYWWHRLQHVVPVFWVTHKLHHVDENMGVTTTMKAHPVSILGRTVIVVIPMAVFFELEPITIFWVGYSARIFQHFVHMNVNCHFGWFTPILASPNQHRVHHSKLPKHLDKNFAAYFPIIDVVFGTYCSPDKVAPPTGVTTGETYNTSLWSAFMQPFTDWYRMARDYRNDSKAASSGAGG